MVLLSSKMWFSLSTILSVLELSRFVNAIAVNVSDTSSLSKRCMGAGNDNIMSEFIEPKFEHAASDAWGGDKSQQAFNDFAKHLDQSGDDDEVRPHHRLTGVRGRCGRRLNNIQFRYSIRGSLKNDIPGDIIGGFGADPNPAEVGGQQPWVDLASADGQDYVTNIHVRVCRKDKGDRICFIRISTKKKLNAWQCGDDKIGAPKDSKFELKNPGDMRLYTVFAYAGKEVDKLQFIWVPSKIW